jgi:hypothetical protein
MACGHERGDAEGVISGTGVLGTLVLMWVMRKLRMVGMMCGGMEGWDNDQRG